MKYLYITADDYRLPTGGGKVVANELAALRSMGETCYLGDVTKGIQNPFAQDMAVYDNLKHMRLDEVALAHVYAGAFPQTCRYLESQGIPVTYTVAAHSVDLSKAEHEAMGLPFPYPHLTDPELFRQYTQGYIQWARKVIVPGEAAKNVVEGQADRFSLPRPKITIIPHGIDLPTRGVYHKTQRFVVGYLGVYGPDKGVHRLVEAYSRVVSHMPNSRLLLGGRDSQQFLNLYVKRGGLQGHYHATGWMGDVADFFEHVTFYVQPSVTEGFGIPAAEAVGHGIPTLISNRAGAADLINVVGDGEGTNGMVRIFDYTTDDLSQLLVDNYNAWTNQQWPSAEVRKEAADEVVSYLSWDRIRLIYRNRWAVQQRN